MFKKKAFSVGCLSTYKLIIQENILKVNVFFNIFLV